MTASIKSHREVLVSIAFLCLVVAQPGGVDAVQIESVADCRELVRQHPDNLEAYRSFWVLARQKNQWETAIEGLESLLAEDPGQPRALLYLGMILSDRGEQRAEDILTRAADGFSKEPEPTGEVISRLALAHWLMRRDRMDESDRQQELAHQVATASNDHVLLSRVRFAKAWQAIGENDYAKARKLFLEVESEVFPTGPIDLQYGSVNGLGYTDWATGRYRSAIGNYRRQASLSAGVGDYFEETSALYNATLMASNLARTPADLERVATSAKEALDAALRSGDKHLEAKLRLVLSEPYDGSDDRRRQASQALALARSIAMPYLELQAIRAIASHDLASGHGATTDTVETIRGAVDQAGVIGNLHEEILGRIALAGALWSLGDHDASLSESLAALDRVDEMRAMQSAEEERARIASTWAHAFYHPIGRLLGSGEAADREFALAIMERLRAHSLIDLFDATDASPPEDHEAETFSVQAVQDALKQNEVLISYQMTDRFDIRGGWQGGAWLILVTPTNTSAYPLPDLREIEAAVNVYLGLMERGDHREAEAASRLFDLLLSPVFEGRADSIDSLVVIPDGVLTALPFAALRRVSNGPPLIEGSVITLSPSVTRWLRQRISTMIDTESKVLGVADPEIGDEADDLPALPHARTEVLRACRRVGGESQAVTGASATEAAVKELLATPFEVLHFATHAEVDRTDPAHTAILLGPGDAGQDGRLGIAEISELGLREPLVVLSACRSAGGVVLQGEGVLGLTRAFFAGGARTVIGNLWPIADRDASVLIDRFYRHLTAGVPAAEALARAQRESWEAGDPPEAWAGLVALGDGDLVIRPNRRRPRIPTPVILVIALLGIAVLAWITRR